MLATIIILEKNRLKEAKLLIRGILLVGELLKFKTNVSDSKSHDVNHSIILYNDNF